MIIGFDGSRAFTDKKTGTENYSYQLLKHLSKLDQTNTYKIFLRSNNQVESESNPSGWPTNFQFITIPFPRLWTQAGLAKQTFTEKLDGLFVPSHTLPLIHKPGLKTVITVHDLGAEYLPKTHQLKQQLYLKLMTHYQLKSASHIIAVSQATKEDIINRVGVSSDKISVVYEGYNPQMFQPVKVGTVRDVLKELDLVLGDYFLFVGTIQPRKNLERLIKAYALFLKDNPKASPLVLAGGKGWLSEGIYALPEKLDIKDNVRFLGYVPDERLPALYSGATAFLFPSLFEGFGLPILEAMACGCPVLTSNTSSMPEVAGKAAVLVNPYSVDAIADGIEKISRPEERNKLVKSGFDQVKKFSWEKAAEQTLAVLTSTLQDK